jgi:predicted ATPase with chaperone activity
MDTNFADGRRRQDVQLKTTHNDTESCLGWDNCHQFSVRRSELDAVDNIVPRMIQLNLSARAYHRILKLSRTIADLAGKRKIRT